MNRFDELLAVTLRNYELGLYDHEDRERERCDTGRPHSPLGIVGNMIGCKCQPPKIWNGLRGFLDPPGQHAEILWYGNITDDYWRSSVAGRQAVVTEESFVEMMRRMD